MKDLITVGTRSLAACAVVFGCSSLISAEMEIHVSVQGDDQAAGTETDPLATLHAARDRVRHELQSRGSHRDKVTVWIHEGAYFFNEPLELTGEDSGTAEAPIVWQAIPNAEVRLVGGVVLDAPEAIRDPRVVARLDAAARDEVQQVYLGGYRLPQLGNLQRRGRDQPMQPAHPELFQDGQSLTLARFPNEGWITAEELSQALPRYQSRSSTPWIHAFLEHNWCDEYRPANESLPGSVERCYLVNALEALDAPGEWFIDQETQMLYVWPRQDTEQQQLVVSHFNTPVSLYGVSHVLLRGLTIEAARVCAIEIAGGNSCTVEQCTLRNTGNLGIHVFGGQHHRIVGCTIHDTGEGAVRIEGGDSTTLEPSGHELHECELYDFNRWVLCGRAGVQLHGVGHRVTRNQIHHGAAEGISIQGSDHTIAGNEISHVCLETDDVGAIYLCQDWAHRGNTIENNYLHDIGSQGFHAVIAIYLDDFTSGTTIRGNVVHRVPRGVLIGGGRDNVVQQNLFVDTLVGVQVDSRGESWARDAVTNRDSSLWKAWQENSYQGSPYVERYPQLATLDSDAPGLAKGNQIDSNVFRCPIAVDLHDGLTTQVVRLERNWLRGDPRLIELADGRPQLAADSPALRLGFPLVSWKTIGRSEDARTVLVGIQEEQRLLDSSSEDDLESPSGT